MIVQPCAHVIREATPADFKRIQVLEVDAGQRFHDVGLDAIADDDPPTSDDLFDALATAEVHVMESTETSGHLAELLAWLCLLQVDGKLHIEQLSVASTHQGVGFGSELIDSATDRARTLNCPAMTLTTFRDVEWNGPWYARRGFTELPVDSYGPQLTELRAEEKRIGLDVSPRFAMIRPL